MFEEYEELGRGGFGSIARVRHRADLKFYAVKKIRCRLPKQQLDVRTCSSFYQTQWLVPVSQSYVGIFWSIPF